LPSAILPPLVIAKDTNKFAFTTEDEILYMMDLVDQTRPPVELYRSETALTNIVDLRYQNMFMVCNDRMLISADKETKKTKAIYVNLIEEDDQIESIDSSDIISLLLFDYFLFY
jgi:hypothetical protein